MNGSVHNAPWGRLLKWISAVTTVLLVGVTVGMIATSARDSRAVPPLLIWLPLLILIGTVPFTIRRYRIVGGSLLIDRLCWATHIPLAELTTVEVTDQAMKGSLRLCGNGGLFSFSGWWWNKHLGRYRAYVTDPTRTVVLRFAERTIVVSPERPEEFARELSTFVTNAEPQPVRPSRAS